MNWLMRPFETKRFVLAIPPRTQPHRFDFVCVYFKAADMFELV